MRIGSKHGVLPRPAQYLLRVDDLCPTVDAERWRRLAALIGEFGIQPILAVVPENRDPDLERCEPDPRFWEQMRAMEALGAAIGLHGYQHLCLSKSGGILGMARRTEFAGVLEAVQQEWIGKGLGVLRRHGLSPTIWVAPRHGLDAATIQALRAWSITAISDGFARLPYTRAGMLWIPQQLWTGVEKPAGVWTICLHPNTMDEGEFAGLRGFLSAHASRFTSVDRVRAEFAGLTLSRGERVRAAVSGLRTRARRMLGG